MSHYGRKQWEEIRRLREQIEFVAPGIRTNTLAEAKADVESLKRRLDKWLEDWTRCENEVTE